MANNPKKVKDPTEVALSAIQEALNISDGAAADSARVRVHSDAAPQRLPSTPAFNESAFDTRPSEDRRVFEPIEEPRPTRRAANDDRETIGQILQAIQKGRPPATSIRLPRSSPASGCRRGLLTISFLPALQASIGQGPAARWCWPGLAALSLPRYCCSTSWRALPGAARNCA
jgi:hypothetical protein